MCEIDSKQRIIDLFMQNVKDVDIDLTNQHQCHCGKEGHWLEKKMGIPHNSKNEPDIYGYEMKKSSNKTTLGDFSATEYPFSGKRLRLNQMNNWTDEIQITRRDFIKIFGNQNPKKNNRSSWSGSCIPTYNSYSPNGQILTVNTNNDIIIYYSFSKDTRSTKVDFPLFLQKDDIAIVIWTSEKMKPHIDNKFNNKGFFICKKIENKYQEIWFGKSFDFEYFIECIKNKKIIFDSGMYQGNSRNYSQFRASKFWDELIIEKY
jgi:hypothetical protein